MKLQHQRSFHVELNYVMGKMEKKLKQLKIIYFVSHMSDTRLIRYRKIMAKFALSGREILKLKN